MPLKLIREDVSPQDLEIISESVENKKVLKIKGPFIQCEVLNGNKRIYPKSTTQREVDKFIKEEISKRNALGEYQHPTSPLINRERACILIESLQEDGNNYIGTAKILEKFPMGRLVYNLLEEKIPVGVSSRGLGTVNESTRRVNEDFKLVTIDVVDKPSAPDAWVEGILEGKEFLIQGDLIVECAIESMKKKLDKSGKKVLKKALVEFINQIGKNR